MCSFNLHNYRSIVGRFDEIHVQAMEATKKNSLKQKKGRFLVTEKVILVGRGVLPFL